MQIWEVLSLTEVARKQSLKAIWKIVFDNRMVHELMAKGFGILA